MVSIMVPTQPDWCVWFCQFENESVILELFNYHHGTGPADLGLIGREVNGKQNHNLPTM